MNLAAVVAVNAGNLGAKPAIRYRDQTISYAELWAAIESIASFLHAAGIGRGDRVGLSMRDHPLHLIAHYSVARIAAVNLPIDHRWSDVEKEAASRVFGASLVLTDGEKIPGIRTLTLDEAALSTSVADLPPLITDDDSDLLISLSSGTTGKPKGALVTHRNMYERFVSQWVAIGYDSRDCFALVTPLFFGAGRSFGMSLLAAGGTVLLAPPPHKLPEILEVLQQAEVTATFLPPTLLRRLLPMHKDGEPPLIGNIDYLLVSGEPLFADEARECRERICPNLYGYYASSEGGGISVLTASDFAEHAATVGIPTFRTEVQIVDSDDRKLGPSEVGRLRYRGPGVATCFLDSDGKEYQAESDGWFYPGDLAERLETGHIALRGRDTDVIIRGGVNVYPAEIEAALLGHTSILETAVVGVDDAKRGQVISAFFTADQTLSESQLRDFCAARLAPYKVPAQFTQLTEMPKRSSGKTDKKTLLQYVPEASTQSGP